MKEEERKAVVSKYGSHGISYLHEHTLFPLVYPLAQLQVLLSKFRIELVKLQRHVHLLLEMKTH